MWRSSSFIVHGWYGFIGLSVSYLSFSFLPPHCPFCLSFFLTSLLPLLPFPFLHQNKPHLNGTYCTVLCCLNEMKSMSVRSHGFHLQKKIYIYWQVIIMYTKIFFPLQQNVILQILLYNRGKNINFRCIWTSQSLNLFLLQYNFWSCTCFEL